MRRSILTILAFAGKEIRQVLRQPKLMMALIAGPFVILGLFAVGFQANPPPLKTMLVVPKDSALPIDIETLNEQVGSSVDLVGSTENETAARQDLRNGQVDLVVITPKDLTSAFQKNEQAQVTVLNNQLDPFVRATIDVAARQAVSHLNRMILADAIAAVQERTNPVSDALPAAESAASDLAQALREGDQAAATESKLRAQSAMSDLLDQMNGASGALSGIDSMAPGWTENPTDVLHQSNDAIEQVDTNDPGAANDAQLVADHLAQLETDLETFRQASPDVLVQPFVADTESTTPVDIPLTDYYSPAVVVVLLQHVVLTFAALSVVGERSVGATELFRVGPVRPIELLVGKFLGYAGMGIVTGAILIALVVFGFGTPMAGSWLWLAGVLLLTMCASLGLGFVIAAAARSELQAVQYAMLALLFTIFFSGLIVSLSRLARGVHQLAFLAPATAGTAAIQDVMFRGRTPQPYLVFILVGYALVTLLAAWLWLRRQEVA